MEQDLSILIADLSGYTALTETHGAMTAADLVDLFNGIVKESLIGDSYLHQAIGDEVLIISSDPNHLAMTATLLLNTTHNKAGFLQVHGGLHLGRLLKRNDNFFGPSINLTSRIASKAAAGTILSSDVFLNSLSEKHRANFTYKGKLSFKNVSEEVELHELVCNHERKFFIDPVCRMLVDDSAILHPDDSNIFFCSVECRNTFLTRV